MKSGPLGDTTEDMLSNLVATLMKDTAISLSSQSHSLVRLNR